MAGATGHSQWAGRALPAVDPATWTKPPSPNKCCYDIVLSSSNLPTMTPLFFLLPLLLLLQPCAQAVLLPLQTRSPRLSPVRHGVNHSLEGRAAPNSVVPVLSLGDIEYIVNITLGGKEFAVSIDTGR